MYKRQVQDVLDLIEYANGDAKKTVWGKKRAQAGHPKPFNLKYIGIDVYKRQGPVSWSWAGSYGKLADSVSVYKFVSNLITVSYTHLYQSDNAWCQGGLLVIEARSEKRKNPLYKAGSYDWRTSRAVSYTHLDVYKRQVYM